MKKLDMGTQLIQTKICRFIGFIRMKSLAIVLSSFSGYEGLNSGIDAMRYLQRAQQIGKVPPWGRRFQFFFQKRLKVHQFFSVEGSCTTLVDWVAIRINSVMLCQVVLTQPSRMQLVNDGRYVLSGGVGALGLVTLKAIWKCFRLRWCLYWAPVPTKLGKACTTACLARIMFFHIFRIPWKTPFSQQKFWSRSQEVAQNKKEAQYMTMAVNLQSKGEKHVICRNPFLSV